VQKAELKALVHKALVGAGAKVVDRTPAGQAEYFDYDIHHADLPGAS
jgi:hypothetical protein